MKTSKLTLSTVTVAEGSTKIELSVDRGTGKYTIICNIDPHGKRTTTSDFHLLPIAEMDPDSIAIIKNGFEAFCETVLLHSQRSIDEEILVSGSDDVDSIDLNFNI